MSGPERLDMSGARWSGPGVTKEQGAQANVAQSQTSTQRGQADLEYIGPTAREQLDRIILQNEQLQRDLEKAKKGEPLRGDAETRLITDVDACFGDPRVIGNRLQSGISGSTIHAAQRASFLWICLVFVPTTIPCAGSSGSGSRATERPSSRT